LRSRLTGFVVVFAGLLSIWLVVPAHSDVGSVVISGAPAGPIEATGAGGASAGYTATATDSLGAAESVTCDGPNGGTSASGTLNVSGTFPLGTTNITCTGADGASSPVSITVHDTTPPTLSNPGDKTAEATSALGAVVSFSLSASDAVDPSPQVNCSHGSGTTFALGTTSVSCTATDASGNTSSAQTFNVTVHDTTPPTLSIPGNQTVDATGASGATVTFSASASDAVDPSPTVSCTPSSGSTFPLGTTNVTCTAKDGSNNSSSQSFSVTVVDRTPPTISNPGDQNANAVNASGAPVSFSVTASDAIDPSPHVACSPASGSTFPLGTTTVSCTATDASGNSTSTAFKVNVRDTTAPTLSVPGSKTAEATSPAGASVPFSVTVSDNVDPAPAVSCTPGSGATFPLGSTTVNCTATDASGNKSTTGSFTVTVHDTTPPSVTVPADQTVEATGPSGAAVSFSASASDIADPSPSVSCSPSSGSTFSVGTTKVNCTAKDKSNNSITKSFNVTVVDTTAPAFNAVAAIKREANSPQGSVVNFTAPTAVDIVDGPIAHVTCSPASGSVFPLGATTVTCNASDSHGNVGNTSFTVRIVDTTPPVLIVPGDRTYVAPSSAGEPTTYFTRLAGATDIADPHPTISWNGPDVAPVGRTVISFTARDASGNTTTGTSEMIVLPRGSVAPQAAAPDRTPPANVSNLLARAGDGFVVITWKPPATSDFGGVIITRQPADASKPPQVVYRGSGTSFRDRGVKNGVEYRYVVTTVDKAGNASAGAVVVALPKLALLRAPRDGARISVKKQPPTFRWLASSNASYYNFQLFAGKTKILSAWPVKNTLTLQRSWKYNGHRYRLTPGTYRWYVWPGIGARADAHYGDLLGSASFTVTR
jgi:HYR domain